MAAPTPERIELENRREDELQEVPEEVLNRVNLSADGGVRASSEEEEGEEGPGCGASQEATASWGETLLPARGEEEEEEEEGSSEGGSSEEEELTPHTCDTPVHRGSASSLQPDITSSPPRSVTPPSAATPSTDDIIRAPLSPVVVMETAAQKRPTAAGGRGSFDDITPELPQKKLLLQQEGEGAEPEDGVRSRRRRGAQSLPPGGGALLLHLKDRLREAPPPGQVELCGGGARGLLKAVFPGNRKEEKRRGGTLPAENPRRLPANQRRDTVGGEESDLDSWTVLQRCSLKPGNKLQQELSDLVCELQDVTVDEEEEDEENQQAYVPHALAFRRSYGIKRRKPRRDRAQESDGQSSCPTEVVGVLVRPQEASSLSVRETMFQREEQQDEDLDGEITRRVQRAARRQAKKEQLKRLHRAQMIQRQLQQVEVKQRELEERGVMVEKALRGEADYWEDSSHGADMELHLGGLGKLDNLGLMQRWFQLVQQKNSLVRYESELMIFVRELQLEDRQSRLQQELRERMAVDDHLKDEEQLAEERLILEEMLEVVEQRDALVSLLEEQRLLDRQEDQELQRLLVAGGLGLGWA